MARIRPCVDACSEQRAHALCRTSLDGSDRRTLSNVAQVCEENAYMWYKFEGVDLISNGIVHAASRRKWMSSTGNCARRTSAHLALPL